MLVRVRCHQVLNGSGGHTAKPHVYTALHRRAEEALTGYVTNCTAVLHRCV